MSDDTELAQPIRHDWNIAEVSDLFSLPFSDLIYRAQTIHRIYSEANVIQISTLLNIKSGGCTEDCGYCAQSVQHETEMPVRKLMNTTEVIAAACSAQSQGATRFCLGASGRTPDPDNFPKILAMVRGIKALGMETCVTLGMLNANQARELKDAGLDYYNHNLDTAPEFYGQIITTRTYQERLATIALIQEHKINLCCGGIIGLGETRMDRAELLMQLANLPKHPESVPINLLVRVTGTPLANVQQLDHFELIRTIAVTRILMPNSVIRLAAGRDQLSDAEQALAFFAGANSIFYGARLLTTDNIAPERDQELFTRLGLRTRNQLINTEPHGCFHSSIA